MSIIECACGCGQQFQKRGKNGHDRKFIKGHHMKDKRGDKTGNWRGGRHLDTFGYVLVYMRDHPNCDIHGYVREHRLVMEQYLGRYLTKYEEIHHINKIKTDNRIENLLLTNRKDHARIEMLGNTRGFKKKDTSGRRCSDSKCLHPEITYQRKDGRKDWHMDNKGGWWCSTCYHRNRTSSSNP